MKLLNKGIVCLSIGTAFLAVSCANEAPWGSSDQADGKIYLNLTADGSVSEGTRADDVSPLVPNSSEFSISLVSNDGSYNNSWNSLKAFNNESGFPMGSYKISASFGDMDSEGFSNPYFYGESTVNVLKGEESNVDIIATLQNAMLSIRYKEELSKFYPGHSANSTTEGHDPISFVQGENRPAYISIGEVSLKLTLTDNSNQTVTFSPAKFKTEPQKHYIVTFGVEGNIEQDNASLSIEWSEEVEKVEKKISLSKEMSTTPAPTIELEGVNGLNDLFEGVDYEDYNPEFKIVALAGLDQATLSITTDNNGVNPLGFNRIDINGAEESQLTIMKNCGLICSGFNIDETAQFAVINLKEFVKGLVPGSYKVTLNVEDIYGRTLENPVEFVVNITGLQYQFLSYSKPNYLDETLTVYLESNSQDLKNQLIFKAGIDNNNYTTVKSVQYINGNAPENKSSSLPYVYAYELTLNEPIDNYEWMVQAQVPNKDAKETEIEVNMPQFKVDTDPFAKYVKIRFANGTSQEIIDMILNNGRIYNGEDVLDFSLTDFYKNEMIILPNLTQNTTYNYSINLGKTLYSGYKGNVQFTTEKEDMVPNGDFETLIEKYPNKKVNQGGIYGTSTIDAANYTNYSTYTIKEAQNWATTNPKTVDGGTNNTWFSQPSVFNSNLSYSAFCDFRKRSQVPNSYSGFKANNGENAMVIRNVAWSPNGTVPSKNGRASDGSWIKTGDDYFNVTVPSISNISVGKMFLGEYSYSNGKETYIEGIPFNSRPSKLTGYYIYAPDAGDPSDFGVVEVKLYNDNTLIASGKAELKQNVYYSDFSVDLEYSHFGLKANKLMIMVASSQYGSYKIEDETEEKIKVTKYHSQYESYFFGATLIVDDFAFEY